MGAEWYSSTLLIVQKESDDTNRRITLLPLHFWALTLPAYRLLITPKLSRFRSLSRGLKLPFIGVAGVGGETFGTCPCHIILHSLLHCSTPAHQQYPHAVPGTGYQVYVCVLVYIPGSMYILFTQQQCGTASKNTSNKKAKLTFTGK